MNQQKPSLKQSQEIERYLALEGSYNIRDIGGYPTAAGGQTRWRAILRGDRPHRLTEASQAWLIEYGLTTVIDLRDNTEIVKAPNVFLNSTRVAYHHLPLFTNLAEPPQSQRTPQPGDFYRVILDRLQPQLRAVLAQVAQAESGPLLIHCTVGKDRTGLVIALLLALAGVSEAIIAADYALTDQYIEPIRVELREQARRAGFVDMDSFEQMLTCPAEAMQETLDYLKQRYDGIEPYCRLIGLRVEEIGQIRRKLIA